MRLRILATVVAATLAVGGLAGCQTNAGTAASVTGDRISESDVQSNVTPNGASSAAVAQAAAASSSVPVPRVLVVQFLIEEQVFEQTLAVNGGVPTDAQLATSRDAAASLLAQVDLKGAALVAALKKALLEQGIKPEFSDTYLRVLGLEYTLIQRKHLTQLADLVALINQAKVTVSLSPRYGTWDPKTLSVSGAAAVPGFLDVQSSAAPPAGGSAG